MTREEFKQILDDERYSYRQEGNKIVVDHRGTMYFEHETLPSGIVFDNKGFVRLQSLETIPPDILFTNKGNVYLNNLRNIPKGVEFNNYGSVKLPYGWNHDWVGNIKGIGYDRLFNKMISLGLFDR